MNRHSIFFSITLAFVGLFLFILISFSILYKIAEHRQAFSIDKKSFDAAQLILREIREKGHVTSDTKEYLEFMNLSLVEDRNSILKDKALHLNAERRRGPLYFKRFSLNGNTYLYIKTHKHKFLLLDKNEKDDFNVYLIYIFILILIIFLLLYITIIKKLQPLSELKNKVKNFANEEFDIEHVSDKKDEISQLANEFSKSAKRLKTIKEARNVFIRNIMHELKTPIAKGQVLIQLPQNEANLELMQKVFYRLESLINEFASIEELISTKKSLDKKEYFLSDIIDNSLDLLMYDEESVIQEFENIKLKVDFKLFSIAIKNLLDNGLKYSTEKKVTIKTENSKIIFENRGNRLSYPLEEYFEPFFKADDVKSNQSFGLGLYIVKHILDANALTLQYEYIEGTNRFMIVSLAQKA